MAVASWEYMIVKQQKCTEGELNAFGKDGWELVLVLVYWPDDKEWVFKRNTTKDKP